MPKTIQQLVRFRDRKLKQQAQKELGEKKEALILAHQDIESIHELIYCGLKNNYPDLSYESHESVIYFVEGERKFKIHELGSYSDKLEDYENLTLKSQLLIQITDKVSLLVEDIDPRNALKMVHFQGHIQGLGTLFRCVLPVDSYGEEYYLRLISYLEAAHAYYDHSSEITDEDNRLNSQASVERNYLETRIADFTEAIKANNREIIALFGHKTSVLFPMVIWQCSWQRGFGVVEGEACFDYQTELTNNGKFTDGYIVNLKGTKIYPASPPQFSERKFQSMDELPEYCKKYRTIPEVKIAIIPHFPALREVTKEKTIHKNTIYYKAWGLDYYDAEMQVYYHDQDTLEQLIEEYEELFAELDPILPKYEILDGQCLKSIVPNSEVLFV